MSPPRAIFTVHGFEPGARPTNLTQLTALFQVVYWPALDAMIHQIVRDDELFTAIVRWDERRLVMNRPLLFVIFKRLSYWLGEALRFDAAEIGYMDDARGRGIDGYYASDARKVFLAAHLIRLPVWRMVRIVVHEQMHHLQNLICLLYHHQRHTLGDAERSMALYWANEPWVDHRKDFLEYRLLGSEYHAEKTARYVVHKLAPIFEWPGTHPP